MHVQPISELGLSLFPSFFLLGILVISFSGFFTYGMRTPFYQGMPRQLFLLIISAISVFLILLYIESGNDLFLISSFSIEIGICFFEFFLFSKTLSVDILVHHVCTPICIVGFLLWPVGRLNIYELGILSLVTGISNIIVTLSKLVCLKNPIYKKIGIQLSLYTCIVTRVIIPSIIVISIVTRVFKSPLEERPEWTRVFLTAISILIFLNFRMTLNLSNCFNKCLKVI